MTTVRFVEARNQDDLRREMQLIGCDPTGAKIMARKGDFKVIKVEGLRTPAANMLKQEMLARGGEAAVAYGVVDCKVETSDALIMGTTAQIAGALSRLQMQPFGLARLAGQIRELLSVDSQTNREWRCRDRIIPLGQRTLVMGIVNVTPDSFSKDGLGADVDAAMGQARAMIEAGAHIIDIGGESTRPGSLPASESEELRRVVPVIERLAAETQALISVDTTKHGVAGAALESGAHIINDITGLGEGEPMAKVVAGFGAGLVLMHMKGTPRDMQVNPTYRDLIGEVAAFLRDRAEQAIAGGVDRSSIAIDPGIGFGKTLEHNLEILRRLREFRSVGFPILIGTSRKAFIGKILDLPVTDRIEGTGATVALSIANGADIVRVHDVASAARIARVADAIVRE